MRQVAIPLCALAVGSLLLASGLQESMGKLAVYFGAQTGMNIYMKIVLSHAVVSESRTGLPAPFGVTALQQVTAFALFALLVLLSHMVDRPYRLRMLKTRRQWLAVALFSSSFVLNIGLNNYSLSLIPISINLIIRSCLPLSTLACQTTLGRLVGHDSNVGATRQELGLMVMGVICAMVAVAAKRESSRRDPHEFNPHFELGVVVCCVSILSASMNLALAGVLGASLGLNPLDTAVYMAWPSVLLLAGPIFLLQHPVSWPGAGSVTDWQVINEVWELSEGTIGLAALSGAFALTYNVLTYTIVQSLSASHTAMAGSFNNAATMVITVVIGMESLPTDRRCACVLAVAVLGNIIAFAGYNIIKATAKEQTDVVGHHQLHDVSPTARDFRRFGSLELQSEKGDPLRVACERGQLIMVSSSCSLDSVDSSSPAAISDAYQEGSTASERAALLKA